MGKKVAGDWVKCIFPFRCISLQTDILIESSVQLGLGKTAANKLEFSHDGDFPSSVNERVYACKYTQAHLSDRSQLSYMLQTFIFKAVTGAHNTVMVT